MKKNLALILSLATCSLAGVSSAQTLWWDGGAANIGGTGTGVSMGGAGTWNTSIANWDQGSGLDYTDWLSGSNAYFGGAAGLVTLATPITANVVTITNKGYNFYDGGNTANVLTVNVISNTTGGGTGTPTIMTNNVANSSTLNIWNSSSSDLRLDGANAGLTGVLAVDQGTVEIGDGATYNGGFGGDWNAVVASNATLLFRNITTDTLINNSISGAGNVALEPKSGVATILGGIDDDNTYTGSTIIETGTLIIYTIDDVNPNAIGTGPLQIGEQASSATFNYQGSYAATTSRMLVLGGNSTSIISGANAPGITFNGPFSIGPNITGTTTKVLELTGAEDAGYPLDTLACNMFDYTSSNRLTLNKQSGTWLVSGSNTFSGGVTFTGANSGALFITNDYNLGISNGGIFLTNGSGTITSTNSNVTIGASRTVMVNTNVAFSTSDTNNLTVAASITGTGYVSRGSSSYLLGVVRFSNDTNNFTGNFSAGFGNTEFTSVADAGTPCSLGAGGYLTNNNSTSYAILRYVGAGNSATHRPLIWAATTGALGLDNTNTGTIAYLSSAALATGSGSKTLNLLGSNTGTNTLAQIVNDSGGQTSVSKAGTGEWMLTGANTYSGSTTVSGGKLLINGSISSGAVTVTNGTLGGTGVMGGPVTVANTGTLAAGDPSSSSVATLTINNSVTSYGTIYIKLNQTAGTSDKLTGISTLTFGGVLSLTNLSGTLTTHSSFQIFSAGSYQGAFASITPATPGPGLAWNTNNLAVNGTLGISAGAAVPSPTITSFSLSGGNLTLQATNGTANSSYDLLTSTNIGLPLSQWTTNLSGSFDSNGNLNLNIPMTNSPGARFYILQEP